MASRDPSMRSAAPVPGLQLRNGEEAALAQEAAERQAARRSSRHQPEDEGPLTALEAEVFEQVMAGQQAQHAPQHHGQEQQQQQQVERELGQPGVQEQGQPRTAVPVQLTRINHSWRTKHQDRNTTGTVYGGQLLRYGLALGQAAASRHCHGPGEGQWEGQGVQLVAMQDVPFKALVPLGALLHLTAAVVCTQGRLVCVHVVARCQHPPTGPEGAAADAAVEDHEVTPASHALVHTHSYWCTFRSAVSPMPQSAPQPEVKPVAPVIPETAQEKRLWMHGRKLLLQHLE
ncbi:hypothetical protein V8C86DRAFT_2703583 [Haematococcus lacustris]